MSVSYQAMMCIPWRAHVDRKYLRYASGFNVFACKMAFQSDNLKKIAPMDISHLENYISNRQIMIEEKLLKCYAEETASSVMVLVTEYCNGRLIDHPSQRQHDDGSG